MSSRSVTLVSTGQSRSLWNYTLSPGWSADDALMLRKLAIKFGFGSWKKFIESGALPGKNPAQLNIQSQRLLGQQSCAEFNGIHFDPYEMGQLNAKRKNVTRKNGIIINTGDKLRKDELERRKAAHRARFELPPHVRNSVYIEDKVAQRSEKKDIIRRLAARVAELEEEQIERRKRADLRQRVDRGVASPARTKTSAMTSSIVDHDDCTANTAAAAAAAAAAATTSTTTPLENRRPNEHGSPSRRKRKASDASDTTVNDEQPSARKRLAVDAV